MRAQIEQNIYLRRISFAPFVKRARWIFAGLDELLYWTFCGRMVRKVAPDKWEEVDLKRGHF